MKKQVILNQITLFADGSTNLQFLKQIIDDDGTILSEIPHRRALAVGDDVQANINDISTSLTAEGWPTVSVTGFDTTSISDTVKILDASPLGVAQAASAQ